MDFQSNCWVNLQILGQPCEFYVPGPKCLPQDPMNPGPSSAGKNTDFCNNTMKPTICDDNLRTYGKTKKGWPSCGGPQDRWASTPVRRAAPSRVLSTVLNLAAIEPKT